MCQGSRKVFSVFQREYILRNPPCKREPRTRTFWATAGWELRRKCSRGCRRWARGQRGSCQCRQQGVTEYKPPLNTLTCHLNCSNCQLHGPIRRGSLSTQLRQETRAGRHLKFKSSFQIFQIKHGDNDINYVGWGRGANSYLE